MSVVPTVRAAMSSSYDFAVQCGGYDVLTRARGGWSSLWRVLPAADPLGSRVDAGLPSRVKRAYAQLLLEVDRRYAAGYDPYTAPRPSPILSQLQPDGEVVPLPLTMTPAEESQKLANALKRLAEQRALDELTAADDVHHEHGARATDSTSGVLGAGSAVLPHKPRAVSKPRRVVKRTPRGVLDATVEPLLEEDAAAQLDDGGGAAPEHRPRPQPRKDAVATPADAADTTTPEGSGAFERKPRLPTASRATYGAAHGDAAAAQASAVGRPRALGAAAAGMASGPLLAMSSGGVSVRPVSFAQPSSLGFGPTGTAVRRPLVAAVDGGGGALFDMLVVGGAGNLPVLRHYANVSRRLAARLTLGTLLLHQSKCHNQETGQLLSFDDDHAWLHARTARVLLPSAEENRRQQLSRRGALVALSCVRCGAVAAPAATADTGATNLAPHNRRGTAATISASVATVAIIRKSRGGGSAGAPTGGRAIHGSSGAQQMAEGDETESEVEDAGNSIAIPATRAPSHAATVAAPQPAETENFGITVAPTPSAADASTDVSLLLSDNPCWVSCASCPASMCPACLLMQHPTASSALRGTPATELDCAPLLNNVRDCWTCIACTVARAASYAVLPFCTHCYASLACPPAPRDVSCFSAMTDVTALARGMLAVPPDGTSAVDALPAVVRCEACGARQHGACMRWSGVVSADEEAPILSTTEPLAAARRMTFICAPCSVRGGARPVPGSRVSGGSGHTAATAWTCRATRETAVIGQLL